MNDLLQFVEVLLCLEFSIIKKCVVFSLVSFGTLKFGRVIKNNRNV